LENQLVDAYAAIPQPSLAQLDSQDTYTDEAPSMFVCPITASVMQDPVIASDGNSYELSALQLYFSKKSNERRVSSPITRGNLDRTVYRNNNLRVLINEWIEKEGGTPMPPVRERTKILLKQGDAYVPDEEEGDEEEFQDISGADDVINDPNY